jgi:hypothetical protein
MRRIYWTRAIFLRRMFVLIVSYISSSRLTTRDLSRSTRPHVLYRPLIMVQHFTLIRNDERAGIYLYKLDNAYINTDGGQLASRVIEVKNFIPRVQRRIRQ